MLSNPNATSTLSPVFDGTFIDVIIQPYEIICLKWEKVYRHESEKNWVSRWELWAENKVNTDLNFHIRFRIFPSESLDSFLFFRHMIFNRTERVNSEFNVFWNHFKKNLLCCWVELFNFNFRLNFYEACSGKLLDQKHLTSTSIYSARKKSFSYQNCTAADSFLLSRVLFSFALFLFAVLSVG